LAGTAKTSSVLKTVAAEAQRQGRTMVAVAPSQSATQKLADETGIKDARNLSKVLADAKDFDERSQPEFDIKKVYLFSKNVDN
jgi:thiamine biosynthesis lipoprotein ApbE